MSSLKQFRDHCRKMAKADHRPECPSLVEPPKWIADPEWVNGTAKQLRWMPGPPRATCDGCVSDADRALFAQMAGEIDDYLAPQVDLFGEETTEPTLETA